MALQAYRHVLRAANIAFKGPTLDDKRVLIAARQSARQQFDAKRDISPDSENARQEIAHAEEVARILRHNIVQGQLEEAEAQKYKLRIHKDIERGDNEQVKETVLAKGGNPNQPCWSKGSLT
ncbi:MAG: hypothetical protein M1823_004897 [Watsoniomyces obsoletus]|nr:MAG: hypothetical protein M1823_004897 [Watsoniomyces obsoletus]